MTAPGDAPLPVSVVIPCFRCADVVERAVASVLAQTRPPAEIILVDDASGDETLAALLELAARDPRRSIRVLAATINGGPSTARNLGWDAATQEFVAFLDADDAWHPRKLEIQHAAMARDDGLALTGHVKLRPGAIACEAAIANAADPAPVGKRALLASNFLPASSLMLRRRLAVRFAPEKRFSEDYLLVLELVLAGERAGFLVAPLARAFKPPYGHSGLSEKLWRMEAGELDTYLRLHRGGRIAALELLWLVPWSLLRFLRRCVIVFLGRLRPG